MDEQSNRPAPRHVIEALNANVRDIAEGRVLDAHAVREEARRMLAEHERAQSGTPAPRRDRTARRARPAH